MLTKRVPYKEISNSCQRAIETKILGVKIKDKVKNKYIRYKTKLKGVMKFTNELKWTINPASTYKIRSKLVSNEEIRLKIKDILKCDVNKTHSS